MVAYCPPDSPTSAAPWPGAIAGTARALCAALCLVCLIATPLPAAALVTVTTIDMETATDVKVERGIAYVADGPFLRVFDVSTPAEPVEIGFLD